MFPTSSGHNIGDEDKHTPREQKKRDFRENMDDNERNHIKTFDCYGDQNTLGLRWKRWLTAFELFADGKGLILNEENVNNRQRRRALLLHLAGTDVQDIFSTPPNTGDAKDYKKAVDALNAYFVPQVNTMYARHCFRQLTQAPGETIRQFATRLRRAVKDCSYGEDTDNQIRDEILCKCSNTYIKRKLLEEGRGLTLAKALEIAENCEKVDTQLAAMSLERKEENPAVIRRIRETRRGSGQKNQSRDPHKDLEPTCYRCGRTGHFGRDPVCPARGQFCRKCGMEGHFQERCKTKQKGGAKQAKVRYNRDPKKGVANVVDVQGNEDTPVYAFAVDNKKQEKIEVTVGGCKLNVIVDSGASTNIIDKQTVGIGCLSLCITDDIIVHGKDEKEHDTRLERVIKRLGERGLTLNATKCQFSMDKLTFVGMVLSGNGISCATEKVAAVTNAREPQNASETRSFLGLVNYCGRFIPDLATISEPLRRLTKAGTLFAFGKEQKEAFEELKRRLSSAETLGYFDKDAPTQVVADASPVGLGAVLTQVQKDGPRVISYASRSLTETERRYSQTEKEALALIWACEKFHPYIYGTPFELVTDHKPLEVIYGPKSRPCARIERWVLRMQPYKFKVRYQPGPKNIADALSRLVTSEDGGSRHSSQAEQYVRFVAVSATPSAMTTREVEEASAEDEELSAIRKCIDGESWDQLAYKQYIPCSGELCTIGQLILRGTRIVIPKKLRPRILSLAHEGHLGVVGTKQKLRSRVWWPGMEKDAEKHCKTCYGCQLVSRPNPPEPIRATALPTGPWRDLAVDLLGPLPTGESILVVVDYYSRYYEVDILRSTVTSKIISSLEEMFARHGLPESLKSDNGPQFIAAEFAEYMEQQGIRHHRVTAKWPQANGEVERQNRSLLKRLQIAHAEKGNWRRELTTYLAAYRSLSHPMTGVSPAELLFGRKMRTKLPELSDVHVEQEVRDRDSEQKSKSKTYADTRRGASYSEVLPGDQVLVQQEKRDKLSTRFDPNPYTVLSKHGNSLVVQSKEGVQYSRNTSHTKKLLQNSDTPSAQEGPARQQSAVQVANASEPKVPNAVEPRAPSTTEPRAPVVPERLESLRRSNRPRATPSYLEDYYT